MTNQERSERSKIHHMFDQAESKRDWPGSYFPALIAAQKALAVWQGKYPEAAKEEADRRAAEQVEEDARKAREYKDSFIGRALD